MTGLDTTPVLCASDHCRPDNHGGPRRAMRGSPLCEPCTDRAWSDLQTVAHCWPGTETMLTAPVRGGDGTGIRSARNPGIDLNDRTVTARQDITLTLTFWAHLLIEEHPTLTAPAGEADTLARFVGANLRHLTHHHDEGICVSIVEDAHRLAKLATRTAYPKGARRYNPGIPCVEHGTDDQGARIPCDGEYEAWVWDGMGHTPDLACTVDPEHVLTPDGFRRLGRTVLRMGATTALARAIIGAA